MIRLIYACVICLCIATYACAEESTPPPFAKAAENAQARCVRIYGATIGRERGYATGLIVSPNGHILTAEGIYLGGDRIRVVMPDGQVQLARVLRRNENIQVALLKIDQPTSVYFDVPPKPIIQPGDWTIAVSNCFKVAGNDEPLSVNLGIMSMRAEIDTRRRALDFDVAGEIILIDAITSNPGSPGGAVVNYDGELVGMIGKLLHSESTGTRLNYVIPSDLLRLFIDGKPVPVRTSDAPDVQSDGMPYVGLRLFRMAGKRAPAYIDRVESGSPAASAGLKKDDLVLAVDDTIVRNVAHCDEVLSKLRPGQRVTMIIKRKQQALSLALTVERKERDE